MASPTHLGSYAVIVLGGGVAGCAAALALVRRGISNILIVEATASYPQRIGESIPPDARLLLERLGVWTEFLKDAHDPCLGSCSSWGGHGLGYNDFLFNPHGTGWHLDRRRFDEFMARQATGFGIELRRKTRFISGRRAAEGGFELQFSSDEGPLSARAEFVVDATGSRSQFARSTGARQQLHDRLSWVGALLTRSQDQEMSQLTMLEAVSYGWWYAARLPDRRLVVMLATDAAVLKSTNLHRQNQWLARLRSTEYMSDWLQDCPWSGVDLRAGVAPCFILDRRCGQNWLAVGDAAFSSDPIAAQGIHKALSDSLQAADVIAACQHGPDGPALAAYHDSISSRFADYLNTRNYFYASEHRWQSAPFWRRRRARSMSSF